MVRDYPPIPMLIDPKSKKPIDPKTKKPIDPKLIPPPPKKNKKAPKFVIPEWATEVHVSYLYIFIISYYHIIISSYSIIKLLAIRRENKRNQLLYCRKG
jgi:hypothetical protein